MGHAPPRNRFARAFHTLFAFGVTGAIVIAVFFGRESPAFAYHGTIGLALVFLAMLRILGGAAGVIAPPAQARHSCGCSSSRAVRSARCANAAMLVLVLALGATGVMMTRGLPGLRQIHALAAYALVLTVLLHLLMIAIRATRRGSRAAAAHQGRPSTEAVPILPADDPG